MANDPNTIQYVIQEDGFSYIASKDRTPGVPGITVSSKGIANGLSTEYNDGYDFGPDSYSPTSTSAIPYTESSGIEESVLYTYNQGGGTIELTNEIFYVTKTPVEDPNNSGTYYQIGVPFNSLSNAFIQINIIGNAKQQTYASFGSLPSATRVPGRTTIISQTTSTDNYYLFYVLAGNIRGNQNNVGIYIDGVSFQVPAVSNANAVGLQWAIGADGGTILIWTDQIFGTTSTPTSTAGIGLNIANTFNTNSNNNYGNWYYWKYIAIQGFNQAIVMSIHTHIDFLAVSWNHIGIAIAGGITASGEYTYGNDISFADIQQTAITIDFINGANLHIGMISFGDITTASGYFYTSTYFVQNTVAPSYLYIDAFSASVPSSLPPNNITQPVYGNMKYLSGTLTPTLSANPPVSGTVYQNLNPYDIEIDLPVYATTSGTAGYVTIAKGSSSSSLTTIGNQFVNGSTSSTSVDIIRLRVPAGWYYEFTSSGVTFGTASVFAD